MKPRTPGAILALTLLLTACSNDSQKEPEDTAAIEYEIPSNACADSFGATVPVEFFPPGKDLEIIDTALPGAKTCYLDVDYDFFFDAGESISWHDIDHLTDNLLTVEPQGTSTQPPSDYEIYIWDNAAIARTPCTVPPESFAHEGEQFGQNYFIISVSAVPPSGLKNSRQLLEEYIVEAFDETFRTTPHCEESEAAAE